jgi:hypothetical protein
MSEEQVETDEEVTEIRPSFGRCDDPFATKGFAKAERARFPPRPGTISEITHEF